jgi:hypothetical protein
MAFVTTTELRTIVADLYKKVSSANLSLNQLAIVDRAQARAQSDIYRYLRARGFTPGQVDAWTDQFQASKDISIYYSILEIGILKRAYREQLDQYAKWIPDLERGREWGLLQTCMIVDGGGNRIVPGASDAPVKNCYGQLNNEMVDSNGCPVYRFKPNMDF